MATGTLYSGWRRCSCAAADVRRTEYGYCYHRRAGGGFGCAIEELRGRGRRRSWRYTNALATSAMLRAGASAGATGETP
ncbi:MAG: hypothetical protein ACLRZH_18075 [Ruthenibacterium lactatiformans]